MLSKEYKVVVGSSFVVLREHTFAVCDLVTTCKAIPGTKQAVRYVARLCVSVCHMKQKGLISTTTDGLFFACQEIEGAAIRLELRLLVTNTMDEEAKLNMCITFQSN